MPDNSPYLEIAIGGVQRHFTGLEGSFERSARFGLPSDISADYLRMGQIDLEIIGGKLREHPEDMPSLLAASSQVITNRSIASMNSIFERKTFSCREVAFSGCRDRWSSVLRK